MKQEFTECKEFDFLALMDKHEIPHKFGVMVLVQMALHKRCNFTTLAGTLYNVTENNTVTSENLVKCVKAGLVTWDKELRIFITNVTISDELNDQLNMYQYPMPMVVPPRELVENMQSAYLTVTNSVLLKDTHHEDDVCLDHLNRCNQVKYSINMNVVQFVRNQWKNMDKPKEGESAQEFEKRKRAFDKYDKSSREVIKRLTDITDVFYLTHRYDKRGRTYCQGYHVNYQGSPWNKACVEFTTKEVTT
jgi:hypothetical protein